MHSKIDITGLKKLQKSLKKAHQKSNGFVGILGEGANREDGLSNIKIASIHEFGSPENHISRRSFLIDTIKEKKQDIEDDVQGIYKAVITEKMTQPMNKFVMRVKGYVDEAFDTEGFGKWEQLKEQTIRNKGSSKILFDKGFLSSSIDTETF